MAFKLRDLNDQPPELIAFRKDNLFQFGKECQICKDIEAYCRQTPAYIRKWIRQITSIKKPEATRNRGFRFIKCVYEALADENRLRAHCISANTDFLTLCDTCTEWGMDCLEYEIRPALPLCPFCA